MYMNDMCSKSDIEWLRNFHERILKREAPIALIFCHSAGLISYCKNPNFFNNKTDRRACRFCLLFHSSALFLKNIPFVFALYSFAMMCNISSSEAETAPIVQAAKHSTV